MKVTSAQYRVEWPDSPVFSAKGMLWLCAAVECLWHQQRSRPLRDAPAEFVARAFKHRFPPCPQGEMVEAVAALELSPSPACRWAYAGISVSECERTGATSISNHPHCDRVGLSGVRDSANTITATQKVINSLFFRVYAGLPRHSPGKKTRCHTIRTAARPAPPHLWVE